MITGEPHRAFFMGMEAAEAGIAICPFSTVAALQREYWFSGWHTAVAKRTMEERPPVDGMRVLFGHLMMNGKRTGTIVEGDEFNLGGSGVAVDFEPIDKKNKPGEIIWGCYYSPCRIRCIPSSKWQFCYPLLDSLGNVQIVEVSEEAKQEIKQRSERIREFFAQAERNAQNFRAKHDT